MKTKFLQRVLWLMIPLLTIFATNVWADETFTRVTDLSQLSDGDVVILVNNAANGVGAYAMSTTQNTNNRGRTAVTISSSGTITLASGHSVQLLTLKINASGKYGFHTGSGYLTKSGSTNQNYLTTNSTAVGTAPSSNYAWTPSIASSGNTNKKVTLRNVGSTSFYLQYNSTGVFSSYKNTQGDPCIFKRNSVIAVTSVSVSPTSKAILVGETFDITATVLPDNASNKTINWSSSATSKATVSSGTVTGVAAGSATITATSAADGTKSASCSVTVYSVSIAVEDVDGNTLSGGSMPTASATGKTITASASANNYAFYQWQVVTASGMSVSSTSSASTTLTGTPTGNVSLKAVYRKPVTVTWYVNGNTYSAGTPTTAMAYGTHVTSLPTAPAPASYCGDVFVGWTDEEYSGNSAPTHLYKTASEFPNATGNQTFYAVFADYAN